MGAFKHSLFPLPLCGYRPWDSTAKTWGKSPLGFRLPGGTSKIAGGIVYSYRSDASIVAQMDNAARSYNGETNLGKKLSSRQRLFREVQQAVNQPDESPVFTGPKGANYVGIDYGHDFASFQYRGRSARVTSTMRWRGSGNENRREAIGIVGRFEAPAFAKAYFPLSAPGHPTVFSLDRKTFPAPEARNMLTSLVPKMGGVGETAVELLSLNIPSLLTSMRKQALRISRKAKPSRIKRNSPLGKRILEFWSTKTTPWLRAAGSDHLEVMFGLLPTIEVFLDAVLLFEDAADRIYGDSFRRRRRRTLFESVSEVAIPPQPFGRNGGFSAYITSIPCTRTVKEQLQITVRATSIGRETRLGAYYGQNSGASLIRRMGLLSPSLGWELLPFSWLLDWFANFSAGLKRRSFFEDVYPIDYAYATYKSTVSYEPVGLKATSGDSWATYSEEYSPFDTTLITTVRKRLDPFGNPASGLQLDAYKISILSALGLIHLK